MQIRRFLTALALCGLIQFSCVSLAHAQPSLTDVRVEAGDVLERVAFSFNERVDYQKLFTLEKPDRLVIDLPILKSTPSLDIKKDYGGLLLKDLRLGRFDEDTSRIVVDLHKPVEVANIYIVTPKGRGEWQLVVDLSPKGHKLQSPFAVLETEGVPAPINKPKPKPHVIIDAGHGGKDSGAVSRSGLLERDITLSYAKALEQALLRTGEFRVTLTRRGDSYILLHDRVKIAREAEGDVFISLHADSNPDSNARGLSVYTLSDKASDAESAALARRENKADIISGYSFEEEDEDVANILIDLAQRATKNRSSRLAETVVDKMDSKIRLLPNAHRFAGFRVLKAPDIPSILIELGFLTNRQDEKLLQSREYRSRVSEGIVTALDAYFASNGLE